MLRRDLIKALLAAPTFLLQYIISPPHIVQKIYWRDCHHKSGHIYCIGKVKTLNTTFYYIISNFYWLAPSKYYLTLRYPDNRRFYISSVEEGKKIAQEHFEKMIMELLEC